MAKNLSIFETIKMHDKMPLSGQKKEEKVYELIDKERL
jgi:hypothetical protein